MRFDRTAINMARAYLFGKGPATYLPGGAFAFIKSRPDISTPDIQFLFPAAPPDAGPWLPPIKSAYVDGFGVRPCLLGPKSRGELRLRSSDPRDPVRIFQNFFADRDDLVTLREGCKRARDIISQTPIDPYRGIEQAPGPAASTDTDIEAWIRKTVNTSSHPSCTCAMGLGKTAVLDHQMRVHGIEHLRVVDASAMPDVISGNLNACVLMMAEKASDMIARG
jgi:choline dehydrogenase-like flavoprotein